ncbi:MAG TPA: lysine 2,3-aminomutase [Bacillales bacterium]|nr:lysine 2,3-aminomutase [Bacillales bacterium]
MLIIKYVVPTFVVDAPGGGGKIALQPNYVISQSPTKTVLRNFEGVITTYPEPENYVGGRADDYINELFPGLIKTPSKTGITSLMNDEQFNLVPKSLQRHDRRQNFKQSPTYSSLKEKREKRDELKEKKFQAQLKKENESE